MKIYCEDLVHNSKKIVCENSKVTNLIKECIEYEKYKLNFTKHKVLDKIEDKIDDLIQNIFYIIKKIIDYTYILPKRCIASWIRFIKESNKNKKKYKKQAKEE